MEDEALQKLKNMLANPVTQEVLNSVSAKKDLDYAIEIGFLPGVTDNVGNTAREIAEDAFNKRIDGQGIYYSQLMLVKGDISDEDAKKIAAVVATSPLVKTAVFGADANWGRVIAACGRAGVNINPAAIDIYLCGLLVAKNGMAAKFSEKRAKTLLTKP